MFKVGDKVTCTEATEDAYVVFGLSGVVVHNNGNRIGVDWDGLGGGHTCGGRCQQGRGWYVYFSTLKNSKLSKETSNEKSVCSWWWVRLRAYV